LKLFFAAVCTALTISATPASAAVTQFTFLNGMFDSNEVPSNVSTGTGSITTLSFDSLVGGFGTLSVNVSFNGLVGNATAAHIHGFSNASANSGVLQGLTITGTTSGTITGSWAPASLAEVNNLFGGLTYVNLHSATFPGGELRGQLVPIPEPGAVGLLGLASLGLLSRRRGRGTGC
jgi:hypothetical protein